MLNVSGGQASATSLSQLSRSCEDRFGPHAVSASAETRPYDVPWLVLDHAAASAARDWRPERTAESIFEEIADHAETHADWLDNVAV